MAEQSKNMVRAVDLFCGGGGTNTGLKRAASKLGITVDLVAIDHWDLAIATHSQNHKHARHLCESADNVDPRKVVPGGRLGLLVASPECTHHSIARGGKPMSDQSRASAARTALGGSSLYRQDSGGERPGVPGLGATGGEWRPMKSKRGETFRAFVTSLEARGTE